MLGLFRYWVHVQSRVQCIQSSQANTRLKEYQACVLDTYKIIRGIHHLCYLPCIIITIICTTLSHADIPVDWSTVSACFVHVCCQRYAGR